MEGIARANDSYVLWGIFLTPGCFFITSVALLTDVQYRYRNVHDVRRKLRKIRAIFPKAGEQRPLLLDIGSKLVFGA